MRIMPSLRCGALTILLLALSACSSSRESQTYAPEAEAEPTPGVETTALPPETGTQETTVMGASEIMRSLSGRSFAYTRGARRGTIEYAADGTFSYEETGKGQGTGVWQASNGKLCEAHDPTSFLPRGTRSECHPFTRREGAYVAGPSRLTPI